SDNVRIFELMTRFAVMTEQEAQALTAAYITMRDSVHRLALQQLSSHVESSLFIEERQQVKASWQHWLEDKQEISG
ncbi:MAG: hypothetical protein ACRC5A_00030, partial [Enterobacteriaceae bacterium]